MLVDAQDNLWALTDGGLFRASLSDPHLKFDPVKTDPPSYPTMGVLRDHSGRLWFGYGNELVEVNEGRLINHGAVNKGQPGPSEIVSIVEDHAGRILVAYLDGLYEFVAPASLAQGEQWRRIELKLKPKQSIRKLLVDSAGDLYVGTNGGLVKRTLDGRQIEITSRAAGSYNVYDLIEDRDLNIWISAWANGIYKLAGEMVVNYTNNDGSNLQAADIFADGDVLKSVVLGEDVVDFSSGVNKHTEALEYPPTIDYSVEVSRVKQEWFGNRLGGHYGKFHKLIIRLRNGRELPLTAIASIDDLSKGLSYYEDPEGKLWVNRSETDGKVYRIDVTRPAHLTFENLAAEFHDVGYGVQMVGDGEGGIWIATARRLCRIRQDRFSCLLPAEGLPEIDPRGLFVDSRGWLWIGQRYKGVSVTKEPAAENPSFIQYSTANGLLSDTAWAFTEDDEGRVYVGTGKGLSRFDPRNNSWQSFTSKDGLAGDDIRSFCKDQQGHIWIAGEGVNRFDPRAEHKASEPPPTYINRVNIMGKDLALPETGTVLVAPMKLASSLNNLTIDFVGVQFQGEDTLLYQHKLEGADADWSAPAKPRSVSYASLSPGSYRFLVQNRNRDGLISPPAVFEFRILQPMYLRWWFVALVIFTLGAIAFSLYRYRVRQLLEVERVRTRIATDLHDDIGASLSRVAILSEVERQQNAGHNGESEERLAEIANSARELVDSMVDIVWSVDPRRDDLGNVVTRVRQFGADVFEAQGIEWEMHVTPDLEKTKLTPEQRRDIFLICKEALNNVARHAGCRHATLSLRVSGQKILVEIKDDGRGFAPEALVVKNERAGHGLANMQARAERLGGSLDVASDRGRGTLLNLSVPLHRRA
jgi:two-component sensor histidine kinase